jgi:hypothetical protein
MPAGALIARTLTHTLLTGVGHTPPWEAAARTAELITSSLTGDPHHVKEEVRC